MSRENSPFIFGDYWLDKRRDGRSPDIWQIATARGRTIVYRTTKCRNLEAAKDVLRAFEAETRSKKPQDAHEAEILPHLFHYLRERGPDIIRVDTIKSSFRAFIGFLMQDELGTGARISDINRVSMDRFRRWRMGPHSWQVPWNGRTYHNTSSGVSGEAVQRNIEDLRAALNHAVAASRIPAAPKIASVDRRLRSKPRRVRLTTEQLGALIAFADHEPEIQAWLWLMIGTAVRPDAALAFDPAHQWQGCVVDMHPLGAPLTNKRNPIVPAILPLQDLLVRWPDGTRVKSRKKWWGTARTKLGLPEKAIPKTIRHTVSTYLRNNEVPGEQISALLGHKDVSDTLERTSEVYAHTDPRAMRSAARALTKLWKQVERAADKWRADHSLTITGDRNKIVVSRNRKAPENTTP